MNSNCILCGKKNHRKLYDIKSYSINKCNNCGLISTFPTPSQKELDRYYQKFSFDDGFSFEKNLRIDARRSLRNLKKIGFTNGELLDIGCGAGFFIDEAKKSGWKVTGIDSAKKPVEYARQKLKLNVIQKDFKEYKTHQRFDIVSLQQVIEHLSNPNDVLKKMRRLLRKDGIVCISTPNINSWLHKILKERFNYFIPPEHLIYYSPKTLRKVLEKNGFEVIRITSYGYPMDLGGIYRALRERKKHTTNSRATKAVEMKTVSSKKQSTKNFIFENYICKYGYPILNLFNKGSMIEIYAKAK